MPTKILSIHVEVVHTEASVDLIASINAELRTVEDAAEVAGAWVRDIVRRIDPSRLCSLVVATKELEANQLLDDEVKA